MNINIAAAIAVPLSLLYRMMEYTCLPADSSTWMNRHRDQPCIFRAAKFLFNDDDNLELIRLFPQGWKSDPGNPLLACVGMLHHMTTVCSPSSSPSSPSSSLIAASVSISSHDSSSASSACASSSSSSDSILSHHATKNPLYMMFPIAISVGTALNRDMAHSACILADVSMHQTAPTVCSSAFLLPGPVLFAADNLLVRTDAHNKNDHVRLKMNIGTSNSYIAPKVEPYGLDSYSYLVEGDKVWFLAPPESIAHFRRLFSDRAPLQTSSFADHHRLGVYAVHQQSGDVVYIPGGWIFVWQNVSPTVSFGSSYLRPWKLDRTIEYAAERSQSSAETGINLRGVFDTVAEGNWGIAEKELGDVQERWEMLMNSWENPRSSSSSRSIVQT